MSRALSLTVAVIIALATVPLALDHNQHSVWYDEALSHKVASQPDLGSLVHSTIELRGYPPLYFMAVRLGLEWRDDPLGLRIVSILCGALTVLALFLLAREIAGAAVGLVAALLLPLTPGFFRYFVDGNAYTLFALASCLSLLWLLRALRSDRRRDWGWYAAAALVGLFAHTLFVFHVAGHLVAAIVWRAPWRQWGGLGAAWRAQRRLLLTWLVAVLPWAVFVAFYMSSSGRVDATDSARLLSLPTLLLLPALYLGPLSASHVVQLLLWPLLQALGVWVAWRRRRKEIVFLLVAMAVPLLAITLFTRLFFMFFPYRFGLGIFPLSVVIAALAVTWLAPGESEELGGWVRAIGAVALGATVLFVATGLAWFASAAPDVFTYQDWDGARRALAQGMGAHDALLVGGGELSATPFLYDYTGPVTPKFLEYGDDWSAAVTAAANRAGASPPRIWIVFATLASEGLPIGRFTAPQWSAVSDRVVALRRALDAAGYRVDAVTELKRVVVLASTRR